ncbi:dixin-like isoform X2 [Astatotilapia calliptera]|uniref:dixin-like isoform X2 n=1 Tax=Astatotilapia calliptera TaxID=8154 RepID=UPI000E419A1A|nr:dixin-like isoform X2 [Astatotilapia calliptera]
MIASLSRGSLMDEVLHGGFNEQQLAAYVSWVNSQLKRKPGLKLIADLRHDLQDGVVLTQLIEIVAGEVLEGVYAAPQNKEESRKNVEEVLRFISSRHIRMPHISARDIVDGNLKSVMRVILALAAHFKPTANHRNASGSGRRLTRGHASHNPLSTVALAQGAAATLASARHDASLPTHTARLHSGCGLDGEKSVCVRALVEQYERGAPDEQDNPQHSSLSSVSPLSSPRAPPSSHSDRQEQDQEQQQSSAESSQVAVEMAWGDSLNDTLEKEVQETRKMVSALQALLLRGSLPEDEQDASLTLEQGNTSEQQLVVIRSRLDQSMEEAQELKRELLCCKQEVRSLQGVKDAQQQRLCTQEALILQMKQELLRASMTKDELDSKNAELQWKLEECNRLWAECKKEVAQKDRLLQQLKHKLEESQDMQNELQRELEHKNSMLQELMSRDPQEIPTSAENNGCSYPGNPAPSVSGAEEVQLLRDALRSLRNNFRDHDPQHHTLDTLEQGIVSLIDRLHVLHTQRGRGKSPRCKAQHGDLDSSSSTNNCQSHSGSSSSTKILYFTGKSPTPSMITIPKRLGEVTLKDVKAAVDREGNYRYHFKALDPEFGTVKEEVFLDEAIVPGWEGKIVAWLEEDCGEERPL